MATIIGVHTLRLAADTTAEAVRKLFDEEILAMAADTPRTVNRGGRSAIASQHLLRSTGGDEYLWLVKASGGFGPDEFQRLLERMRTESAPRSGAVGEFTATGLHEHLLAYDAGPRDSSGRPTGSPRQMAGPSK